jgi:putative SOS response-associated peptidase YedK
VWPRPPFLRCQRDQDRLLDPARAAGAEFRAELERGAHRSAAGRPLRCDGGAAQLGPHALGLDPLLGQGHKIGYSTINARAEEVESKTAFRDAFRQRRCLVPLDSFYEWKKTETGKQPYAIGFAGGRLMAMAGLWDTWRSPQGERVRSFSIVTTRRNELCAQLHNRMPVVLTPADWPAWLGEEPADVPHLKALLAPYAGDDMICWPVSARVGNVKNNDPSLIERVAFSQGAPPMRHAPS